MISAVSAVVAGVVGVILVLVLNAFVFDEYDAYGELSVPGSGRLALPAGEVTISFHTATTGSSGGGFPVPALQLGLTPPDGVPDPVVTESIGTVTSINNDVHVRVWIADIAREAVYDVTAGGDVRGYIGPRLAFGRDSAPAWPLWVFGGLAAAGAAGLALALWWRLRAGRASVPLPGPVLLDEPDWPPPVGGHQPSGEGIRLHQLERLAALRDSGALTDAQYEAEKRRLLES